MGIPANEWEAQHWALRLQDDTSNKFYEAFIIKHNHYGFIIAFHWGRIGAPNGQWQAFTRRQYHAALHEVNLKIITKIRKGYEQTHNGENATITTSMMRLIEANLYLEDGTPPIFKSVEDANQWLEKQ